MSLYDLFGTDKKLEETGIILDYGDCQFHVKRAGQSNHNFQQILKNNLRPYKHLIDTKRMDEDDERYKSALLDAFVRGVVIKWTGNVDGKNTEYSVDACKKLFNDLPDLFIDVIQQSTMAANFRKEEVEETAKKS